MKTPARNPIPTTINPQKFIPFSAVIRAWNMTPAIIAVTNGNRNTNALLRERPVGVKGPRRGIDQTSRHWSACGQPVQTCPVLLSESPDFSDIFSGVFI